MFVVLVESKLLDEFVVTGSHLRFYSQTTSSVG